MRRGAASADAADEMGGTLPLLDVSPRARRRVRTWVSVPSDQLRVVAGDEHLARYRSSEHAERSFCRHCGSTLLFASARWAGEVHVTRANLSGELDKAPQVHAFYSDKAEWIHFRDELPRRGGASGVEPLDP